MSKTLGWVNGDLAKVNALHDLRAELKTKQQVLYDRLIDELQRLIYGQHSDDETLKQQNLTKMETLAKALEMLGTVFQQIPTTSVVKSKKVFKNINSTF